MNASDSKETLNDLRNGTKHLIIATSFCEEGMDTTVCNVVICFEPPPDLESYLEKGTSPEHEVQVCHHVSEGAREDTSRVAKDKSRDEREIHRRHEACRGD